MNMPNYGNKAELSFFTPDGEEKDEWGPLVTSRSERPMMSPRSPVLAY